MNYQHIILPLHREGKSIRFITAEIKKIDDTMTYYAVKRFVRDFENYSSKKTKEYEPRKYGAHFDHIKSLIEDRNSKNSSTTCKEIANTLRMQNIHISSSQIRRYRSNLGFKRATTKYCHTIREQNKVARVLFAQEMIAHNESFYDCVFTDECTFQIDSSTRSCFTKNGDPYARLRNRAKHPGKLHVWGGISCRGATQIAIFSGTTRMNSEYYCRIIERLYVPFNTIRYRGFARLVQDNAPTHISSFTRQKLQEWNVELLNWPAEYPNLNPIELVWGNMKNFIRGQGVRSLSELKAAISEYWERLTPEACEKYIMGIKRRLRRVVKRNGGNIIEGRETSCDFEAEDSD